MQLLPSKSTSLWHGTRVTLICLLSAGCSQSNLTHSDKISPASGDAVRAAALLQTVDPWPDYVLDTDVSMDGELAVKRVNDYKKGETKPLEGERSTGGSSNSNGG
jgi:hypothetical protein